LACDFKAAKEDICNIRSVCKDLRDAAAENFVVVLQDRRFRLTRGGLLDLEAICNDVEFAPRIKTLTFGTAQIAGNRRRPELHRYINHDMGSIKDMRELSRRQTLAGTIDRAYENGNNFDAGISLERI
jgi:hypothetical protein